MCSSFLDKVEKDLNKENDVNSHLNLDKSFLMWLFSLANDPFFITIHVNLLESKDKRGNKQGVDDQEGNHEVPDLAEGPLGINEVPLELWLTINNLIFFIGVFVNVINHHLLKI